MGKRVLVIYREPERVPPYRDALVAADLEPALVVAGSSFSMDDYSGLLLLGGTDVNPALYNEARAAETDEPDPQRDSAELEAVGGALNRGLPIFGICRGLQLLNVYHGGTLTQHLTPLERHRRREGDRSQPAHRVVIEEGSLLHEIAGTDVWEVNSRHHQAIKALGVGLRVSATDPEDNIIEAVERPDRPFVLAVQWHPEDQVRSDERQFRLFRSFADAVNGSL